MNWFGRAAVAIVLAAHLPAQATPRPDKTTRMALGEVRGSKAEMRAYTPKGYLHHRRQPLFVVLPDRGESPNRVMDRWPQEIVSRKRGVFVVPYLKSSDYRSGQEAGLRAVVRAALTKALSTWTIDPDNVFVIGAGHAAPHALACGAEDDRWTAVAALMPRALWRGSTPLAAKRKLPGLVLTIQTQKDRELGQHTAAAMQRSGLQPRVVHDAGRKAKDWDAHAQRILEWCLDRGEDRVVARKVAKAKADAKAQGEEPKKGDPKPPKLPPKPPGWPGDWPPPGWSDSGGKPDQPGIEQRIRRRTEAAAGEKENVIAIKGSFDQVEDVLTKLKIPHELMKWEGFLKFDLKNTRVVLINCSGGQEFEEAKQAIIKKLRQFVMRGGRVFTTDWAVRYPLAEVFPDYVMWADLKNKEAMMPVRPGKRAANHVLLQNVFPYDHPDPAWQLDASSWLLKFKNPKRVTVLLESDLMRKRFGNGVIGALVPIGRSGGQVLNVVSHFSHQGKGGAAAPMWQLIVNFIHTAKADHAARKR